MALGDTEFAREHDTDRLVGRALVRTRSHSNTEIFAPIITQNRALNHVLIRSRGYPEVKQDCIRLRFEHCARRLASKQ